MILKYYINYAATVIGGVVAGVILLVLLILIILVIVIFLSCRKCKLKPSGIYKFASHIIFSIIV